MISVIHPTISPISKHPLISNPTDLSGGCVLSLHTPYIDIASAKWYDASIWKNSGSIIGATRPIDNKGIYLDGVDDYINCGNKSSLECDTITISMFVKVDSWASFKYLLSKRGGGIEGYSIQMGTTDLEFRVYLTDDTTIIVRANALPNVDEWFNIVGTYDKTVGKMYINGVQQTATDSGTAGIKNDTSVLNIAAHQGGNTTPCSINDVRIHNRALSVEEVEKQYNQIKRFYQ